MRLLLVCLALLPAALASISYAKPLPHQGGGNPHARGNPHAPVDPYAVDPHAVDPHTGRKPSYVRPSSAVGGPGNSRFDSSRFSNGRFDSSRFDSRFDGSRGSGSRSDSHPAANAGGRYSGLFDTKPHQDAGPPHGFADGSSRGFGDRSDSHPSSVLRDSGRRDRFQAERRSGGGRGSFRDSGRDNIPRASGRLTPLRAPNSRYPSASHQPTY